MISFKDFFSFKKNRWFWLNIIALIAAPGILIVGALYGLDVYTRHGESFEVPHVTGMKLRDAHSMIDARQMKTAVVDYVYTEGIAHDIVLDQTPAGGSKVKRGRTIYLTVNTAVVPKIEIPDLIDNSSMRQAAAKLKALAFGLTEPELVPGEQDWVYGIKYRGRQIYSGDSVPKGSSLTLCVGDTHLRDSLAADTFFLNMDNAAIMEEPKVDESWF